MPTYKVEPDGKKKRVRGTRSPCGRYPVASADGPAEADDAPKLADKTPSATENENGDNT